MREQAQTAQTAQRPAALNSSEEGNFSRRSAVRQSFFLERLVAWRSVRLPAVPSQQTSIAAPAVRPYPLLRSAEMLTCVGAVLSFSRPASTPRPANIVYFVTDDQDQMLGGSFPTTAPGMATPLPKVKKQDAR